MGHIYQWQYSSVETGKLERANQNSNWMFSSLEHNDIVISGETRPDYVVSHQLNQAIPSYFQNMTNASMYIKFSVSVVAQDAGGPSFYFVFDKTSDNWIAN